MRLAEAQAKESRATSNEGSFQTKFEADREASVETDPVLQLINSPVADMFTTGEPDESSLVPLFGRRWWTISATVARTSTAVLLFWIDC
ncbi:hypothetical protein PC116_g2506 [Phytophthora cactorum]|uniref:Uncharacterized protein n=1 Tax=Phytophthora cactorum TaxID=29920 RepID=A0A329T2I5_9STRA|nr:hypothetical protein PC114_g1810 [Phytophthora cactorum]KAG2990724.1 hypothetical protein PC120_g22868 [Phytophthora cactorum]KAG3187357.1 hypothetical protein PC128_g12639 [Phytophthora cactorum]KAG4249741.1 hypothetical protein PC116_g2506 [Phytophthora cactorum]RAW43095.1 hypothetical protein PC110_g751 [Phytophthora cactorum]